MFFGTKSKTQECDFLFLIYPLVFCQTTDLSTRGDTLVPVILTFVAFEDCKVEGCECLQVCQSKIEQQPHRTSFREALMNNSSHSISLPPNVLEH